MTCSLARQLNSHMISLAFNDYSILFGEAHHRIIYSFLYFCECLEVQYNMLDNTLLVHKIAL